MRHACGKLGTASAVLSACVAAYRHELPPGTLEGGLFLAAMAFSWIYVLASICHGLSSGERR